VYNPPTASHVGAQAPLAPSLFLNSVVSFDEPSAPVRAHCPPSTINGRLFLWLSLRLHAFASKGEPDFFATPQSSPRCCGARTYGEKRRIIRRAPRYLAQMANNSGPRWLCKSA